MVILSNSDMFDVRISSLLADYDRDTLSNLYQPIIGYSALAIYFTLWSEANNQKILSFSTHEQILLRMQMAAGHFVDARKRLEAVGLVKTKLEKAPGVNIYHYELLAPKTPFKFFKDTILYGMLIQSVGEEEAFRVKKVYETSDGNLQGEDISSKFSEVFHPDYDNGSFLTAANDTNNTIGRNKSKISTQFNYEVFFAELSKISQISSKDIYKKELKEIERLACLYNVDEKEMAFKVSEAYDPNLDKGHRIDLQQISDELIKESNYTYIKNKKKVKKSKVASDSQLANKINLFETTAPKDILRLLQNGTKVAYSDLKIIETLSKEYRLTNGVINVIIDFVLAMNQNVLSRSFAEKIAASFNRENIETTIDAMNYCNNYLDKINQKAKKKTETKVSETNKIQNKEISKDEWNDLFEKEGEKDDGKIDSELPF